MAKRDLDNELSNVLTRVASKEVARLDQAELEVLRVLSLAELNFGLITDPNATAAWLDNITSREIEQARRAESGANNTGLVNRKHGQHARGGFETR